MRTSAIALTMPVSSFANDAAWSLLKQNDSDYDLTRLMSEEDQQAAARHVASLSPEKQEAMRKVSEAFRHMPDEAKGQLTASAHQLLQQHSGRLGEVLPQGEHSEGVVTKFVPLVIGAVFALDALNRSQGAKASLVGNVFTDMGNAVTGTDMFGESNYGDMFEYENQSSIVNPLTGTQHAVVDDPSAWQRTWMGATSTAGSFLNPFAALGAAGKGASRLGGKATSAVPRTVGRAQVAGGKKLSQLGSKATAEADKKLVGQVGRLDSTGRRMQVAGQQRIGRANTAQAARTAASKEANQLGNLAGGSRRFGGLGYRAIQGAMRTDMPELAAAAAMSYLGGGGFGGGGNNDMSGGMTGFGTGYGGAGGANDISNVQGNALGDKQIWNPEAYSGQQRFNQFEGQSEFGGFGAKKGENMFVNDKGNEIKKEVTDLMYKAKCAECGKEDCVGKMHCGTMKADDKKKPAHGMVIVIGSKAGPGPSKDGKREKLDSEKKEE